MNAAYRITVTDEHRRIADFFRGQPVAQRMQVLLQAGRVSLEDGGYVQAQMESAVADALHKMAALHAEAVNIVGMINDLRADEGDSVTFLCDNPDFNGQPNNAVEVSASWTDYKDERFTGDTLEAALTAACFAKAERKRG
jgi:hypothetical protein